MRAEELSHSWGSWTVKEMTPWFSMASDFMWHLKGGGRLPNIEQGVFCVGCSLFCCSSGQQVGLHCGRIQSISHWEESTDFSCARLSWHSRISYNMTEFATGANSVCQGRKFALLRPENKGYRSDICPQRIWNISGQGLVFEVWGLWLPSHDKS